MIQGDLSILDLSTRGFYFQVREDEESDQEPEDEVMGMSPDAGFASPKLPHRMSARFSPPVVAVGHPVAHQVQQLSARIVFATI